jgi:hypothetical protein
MHCDGWLELFDVRYLGMTRSREGLSQIQPLAPIMIFPSFMYLAPNRGFNDYDLPSRFAISCPHMPLRIDLSPVYPMMDH